MKCVYVHSSVNDETNPSLCGGSAVYEFEEESSAGVYVMFGSVGGIL